MADYVPIFANGAKPVTHTTSAAVAGGQVLIATGSGTVGPASAASGVVVGVAAHDAGSGARVPVWPIVGVVHETPVSTGTVTGAVSGITSSSSGGITTATIATAAAAGTLIGHALTTATAPSTARWIGRN